MGVIKWEKQANFCNSRWISDFAIATQPALKQSFFYNTTFPQSVLQFQPGSTFKYKSVRWVKPVFGVVNVVMSIGGAPRRGAENQSNPALASHHVASSEKFSTKRHKRADVTLGYAQTWTPVQYALSFSVSFCLLHTTQAGGVGLGSHHFGPLWTGKCMQVSSYGSIQVNIQQL